MLTFYCVKEMRYKFVTITNITLIIIIIINYFLYSLAAFVRLEVKTESTK